MVEVYAVFIVYVLFAHFVADFVFQTDWMAKNKSSSLLALNMHILTYSSIMIMFVAPLFYFVAPSSALSITAKFVCFNASAHIITDYFTSRLSTKLWLKGDRHKFFIVIGFDQFLHATVLVFSTMYV